MATSVVETADRQRAGPMDEDRPRMDSRVLGASGPLDGVWGRDRAGVKGRNGLSCAPWWS